MKHIITRTALVLAAVGTAMVATLPHATAATGAGAFTGQASIGCFGCGASGGSATLSATGVFNGAAAVAAPLSATYSVIEAAATCPLTGSATGAFGGVVNGTFTWTRLGATALITTAGDINGAGVAAFAVTSPIGQPCGGPVTATVVGAVAGT